MGRPVNWFQYIGALPPGRRARCIAHVVRTVRTGLPTRRVSLGVHLFEQHLYATLFKPLLKRLQADAP
jgi:hypothetical protein